MEEKSPRHIAAHLRNVEPPNISSISTCTPGEENPHCNSSISENAIQSEDSSSDSDSDDFATVHFKLAVAVEPATSRTSGPRFVWPSMKYTLVSGASNAAFTKRSEKVSKPDVVEGNNVEKTAIATEMQEQNTTSIDVSPSKGSDTISREKNILATRKSMTKQCKSSASSSISSDDDVVLNILHPLFSKPLGTSMQFSKVTSLAGRVEGNNEGTTSVLDDPNPLQALSKILDRLPFNPFDADLVQEQFVFKSIVSLVQLSIREDNIIEMDIKKSSIVELSERKNAISPFMDVSNLLVKHSNDEFFTFCTCSKCLEYREIVFQVMVEQFKAGHMAVMLLGVLIKIYGPMLKNVTAYNKFDKLLEANREIYWITCGIIYSKKSEHMNFIYDESLSDHMILVLFSSILMANNPILLLQILAFHVECIVKAYAEGFMEIVEPDAQPDKTPAEEMLKYILDGYDDLCRISSYISLYLYAFENDFLHRISLNWSLLCERLYQTHVYMHFSDTMLGCIITLKQDVMSSEHAALIKRYILFDDQMNNVNNLWTKAWIELNNVNLSETERKRRQCLLDMYHIFNTVIQDAMAFSLEETNDENDFYDFQILEDRRLAWQNIMAYTKMKWPDGFFDQPNILVCDDKCKKCNASLEYHKENCKCITCSIAGGPLPPQPNADGNCYKCLTNSLVDKETNPYESKILNVYESDDFTSSLNTCPKSTTLKELGQVVDATIALEEKRIEMIMDSDGSYHISWAVYKHLRNRQRYRHTTLEERFFCQNCTLKPCLLARKILNNEISRDLSVLLIHHYQPFVISHEELLDVLTNIIFYNHKMIGSNVVHPVTDVHDFVVKNYWTFVISLYASYFLDMDEKCPLNLGYFDTSYNDIGFRMDYKTYCIGSKEDRNFLDFLDKIKSLSPCKDEMISEIDFTLDVHSKEFRNKLNNFLNLYETRRKKMSSNKKATPPHIVPDKKERTADVNTRKPCKERTKKCCYEHPDLSEHCKEAHTGKKRIKKECNHARMNETRDRLRKKLSKLMTARKHIKSAESEVQPPGDVQTAIPQPSVKQPPSLKSVATAATAHSNVSASASAHTEKDSLECLNRLCKRISHQHTGKNATNRSVQTVAPQKTNRKPCTMSKFVNSPAGKKLTSNLAKSNNGITCCCHTSSPGNNINNNAITVNNDKRTVSVCLGEVVTVGAGAVVKAATGTGAGAGVKAGTGASASATMPSNAKGKDDCNWDVANEIYELIGNCSKDQTEVRKWINDTLSYIEGCSNIASNYKKQPQPTNPKKAAKKAKQKQRKEEEKRIAELHDLRGQFNDIYFKEFADKLELKSLKVGKKRDKKKIAELEANIKKLQRAKGKVETAILELIATVKQTNTEFKFSYLPTKEQQLAKLKELDMSGKEATSTEATQASTLIPEAQSCLPSVAANNFDVVLPSQTSTFTLPYVHTNEFLFQPHPQVALQTTMCYAPPPREQLTPDAMAANETCNSNTDASKRIVTIRRLNLPNVPEPQVTVTAKGSSPDKDKLLYTFVNGQLVQTGATVSPANDLPLPVQHGNKALPEQLISISMPPLSKTQLKKERRRLAKLAAEEAQATAEAAIMHQRQEAEADAQQHSHGKATTSKSQTMSKERHEQSSRKLKKQTLTETQTSVPQQKAITNLLDSRTNKMKKKQQQTYELSHSLPTSSSVGQQCNARKGGTIIARRSASTTTSCSASTSATATPTGSEVNTRDNSVCSSKPTVATAPLATMKDGKQGQNAKKPRKVAKSIAVQPQSQMQTQNSRLTALEKKSPTAKLNDTPSASQSRTIAKSNASLEEIKRKRMKRNKLIDNGQFDNNPFKSLHLQDSGTDSEWELRSSSSDEVVELDLKIKERKPENQTEGSRVNTSSINLVPPSQDEIPAAQRKRAQRGVTESTIKDTVLSSKPNVKGKAECKTQPHNQVLSAQFSQRNVAASNTAKLNSQTQESKKDRTIRKAQAKLDAPPKQQKPKVMQIQQQQQSQPQPQQPALQPPGKSQGDGRHGSNSKRGGSGRRAQGGPSSAGDAGGRNTQAMTSSGSNRRVNRNAVSETTDGKPLSKRAQKQAQRGKKYQSHYQQQTDHNQKTCQHDDCSSGIPTHMGYFNPNVLAPSNPPAASATKQYSQQHQQQQQPPQVQQQQQQYKNLTQQMQGLRLDNAQSSSNAVPSYASVSNSYAAAANSSLPANVSIMDQLNRGVQVENLSLPPGITLTKVDPIKSEQLRQKSESIKKLSKPLQPQPALPHTTFQHQSGATIIAPPVTSVSGYYGAPYGMAARALDQHNQSGIIMVEANLQTSSAGKCGQAKPNVAAAAAAAKSSSGKRSKKRRNKPKSDNAVSGAGGGGGGGNGCGVGGNTNTRSGINAKANNQTPVASNQPEMITLRNPMFHGGPMGAAATILQQPGLIPARALGGLPLPTTLPMDQPAAIIKNENGMFTIRNPALHQAVTSGLTLGGYRQFGNVNYYTPQEAAAEAVRATQTQQDPKTPHSSSAASFSYFSSSAPAAVTNSRGKLGVGASSFNEPGRAVAEDANDNSMHKTISISCTSINNNGNGAGSSGSNGGLKGDAAIIARPAPQTKCISAIGSEIKSAQQHKQKCKESQQGWTTFSTDLAAAISPLNTTANDNLTCGADGTPPYLGAGGNGGSTGLTNVALQDKYQQSSYYNGFSVFPANNNSSQISSTGGRSSNTGSLFDGVDCHMHHSCGDDSPPPTITGYNSYLEGIPNTGIIRYDDASFLKNLIPGQNLNNEVSIHNVNDSNFTRNSSSPVTHRVEITPVCVNRPPSVNIFEQCSAPGAPQHPTTEQQAQTYALNTANTANYSENPADYRNDANLFNTNSLLHLSDLGGGDACETKKESFKPYNYDFEAATEKQKLLLDLNDLLLKNGTPSQRTSPYLDESTLQNFVQNLSTLKISTPLDEQRSTLNGASSTGCGSSNTGGKGNGNGSGSGNSNGNGSGASTSNTSNGWW